MKNLLHTLPFLVTLAFSAATAAAAEVTLEQIISREHPQFDPARATLAVGQDGLVYLGSIGPDNTAYVVRMTTRGDSKFGGSVTYALANVAANRDGVIATANGHFAHKVAFYDRSLQKYAEATDFLVNDQVGWDAPSHVEAGESGDFYGLDQHRNRILRLSPQGKVLNAYPIPREGEGHAGLVEDFRVCEARQVFYLLPRQGPLQVVGFDGQLRWTTPHRVGVSHLGTHGGYDVDEDGTLYVVQSRSNQVMKIDAAGQPAGEIALRIPDFSPSQQAHAGTIIGLAIAGNEILLKRWDPTTLFERYDLSNGAFKGAVASNHERLTVSYADNVWKAGEPLDFAIDFHAASGEIGPQWQVWLRPLNHLEYRKLPVVDGKIHVPAELGGVYQVKVTPEVQPWQRGKASDYLVRGWVEVRAPGSHGSLSVLTPHNRVYYGRGDEIPFSILARGENLSPVKATVTLQEKDRVLATSTVSVTPGKVVPIDLPERFTAALRAGEYELTASAPGLTSVSQPLILGPGTCPLPFLRMRYGDYGATYPSADVWNAPDVVAAHVERERRLGFDTFVDRIGTHLQIGALEWDNQSRAQLQTLSKRLQDDPAAAAPQTLEMVSPLLQVMAAYSAFDMRQIAILLYMDAGLPLGGPGHDHRTPEKMAADLQKVTSALLDYPAFRGWSWHANWWIYSQRGSAAATSPEQKAAYEAALQQASETGTWSPVLDEVSNRRLGFAVEAQEFFRQALLEVAPDERLKTASAGTYRNVESYPPISFQNVEEVDLQGQFEQIFLPYFPTHAVDFYRRPGKPVWGHPEVWNDAGTGGQILPELFSMLMRSPDGIGTSGVVPPWTGKTGIVEDSRLAHFGTASIFRSLNKVLARYGGWISTLDTDDRVAIVGSSRQFKIDEWGRVTGRHFARLLEAYVGCLHAHHPASIVFVEDLEPDSLARYEAVLVVDQWVELEPALKIALQTAAASGTEIFYDGTCRAELMSGFTPLGISFDNFEQDRHPASDDAAYYRFPQYVERNRAALATALDAVTPPAARCDNMEVWLSQLKSEQGRYLFAVNNTSVPLEPSQMWRTSLHVASLLPVVEEIELREAAPAVYDVFALKRVMPQQNTVTADLRDLPARLFALLPAAIDAVSLHGPTQVEAGQAFRWQAHVQDERGQPIAASIPLRVRLVDAEGSVLDESFVAATSAGAQGELTAPFNVPGRSLLLQVTELCSGRTGQLKIGITPAEQPLSLQQPPAFAAVAAADAAGESARVAIEPSERDFGPHLRDVAVSGDGKTALINAMNWNQNLYALDTGTGKVRWRNKIGHHFAYAPQAFVREAYDGGFAVQGFDYHSAEGYHLFLLNEQGQPQRRFALYGLPRRLPHRFVPGLISDRDNPLNNFALAADGSWVAAAGDLGLAVWDSAGKLLWKQDWWRTDRQPGRLAAVGNQALLVAKGTELTSYAAPGGGKQWSLELAATGAVRKIVTSRDGRTSAVLATTDGGRIFVLREGQLVQTLVAAGEDVSISADGSRLVAVDENVVQYFTVDGALQWSFAGDDRLRNPRLSSDGQRVAVCSELGSVYVLDERGEVLHQQDNGALTVPSWLPDGDLLLANWMGEVSRLGRDFTLQWNVHLQPQALDVRAALTAPIDVPTAKISGWGNASETSLPLTPNLLSETKAIIKFVVAGSNHIQLVRRPDELVDGSSQAPDEPWLDWGDINWFAESNPFTSLELDTFRKQLRVEAITFVEDADRPDSWLRDAALEYWDAAEEAWVHVQPLLSDAAVHTHKLKQPIEAARFRVVIPRGFYGNLRLAEIVLHGEVLGASHPDAIAKRPVAVLFDDSDEFKNIYPYPDRWSFQFQNAFSGGRFWQVNTDQMVAPAFLPTFGHTVPNWDWEIVEDPQPGQYRWAQWSWRALSPDVQGATLQLGNLRLHAGEVSGADHLPAHQVAETVPGQWRTVRVDLWKVAQKPLNIQTMYLGAISGPVGFDQVLLGRSEAELDMFTKQAGGERQ